MSGELEPGYANQTSTKYDVQVLDMTETAANAHVEGKRYEFAVPAQAKRAVGIVQITATVVLPVASTWLIPDHAWIVWVISASALGGERVLEKVKSMVRG